ncbi:MAG: hypothetical protein HY048_19940 [Acidobacteria bacterium]|nr:hypothetical protein [Acidobacteriota bacterium]
MKRTFITILSSLAVVASLSINPAYAQSRGGGHAVTPAQAHPSTPAPSARPANGSEGTKGSEASGKPSPITVAQRIDAHPQLVTRLTPLVPAGMTLDQAAAGFKNQGQFIAALHVSHNLNIPFDKLKAEMTGADHDSLGKAIQNLQPTADAKAAAKTAEAQARGDLKAAGKATTTKKTDTDKDGE